MIPHLTVLTVNAGPGKPPAYTCFDVDSGWRRGPLWPSPDLAADYAAATLAFRDPPGLADVEAGPLLVSPDTDDGSGRLETVLGQQATYRRHGARVRHFPKKSNLLAGRSAVSA